MDKPGAFAFKCKCCNNPWQLAEGNGEIDFGFCAPCKDKGENLGLDPKNIDEKSNSQSRSATEDIKETRRRIPCFKENCSEMMELFDISEFSSVGVQDDGTVMNLECDLCGMQNPTRFYRCPKDPDAWVLCCEDCPTGIFVCFC